MLEKLNDVIGVESPFMCFMGHVSDYLFLNLLWILCALPLVTIGPATAALFAGVVCARQGDGSPCMTFVKTFKSSFSCSLPHFLFFSFCALVVYADVTFAFALEGIASLFAVAFSFSLVFLFAGCFLWTMDLDSRSNNQSWSGQLKKAFFLTLGKMPQTLVSVLVFFIPVVCFFQFFSLFAQYFWVWLLGGVSLPCLMCSLLFHPKKERGCEEWGAV